MPCPYDAVASRYDEWFSRPVDEWEDARLATLLAPHVDGGHVLDLGCGTGWVLDHLHPRTYLGMDASSAMLTRLQRKHPDAATRELVVGAPGWEQELPSPHAWECTAVVSTWAAHEFGDLSHVLERLAMRLGRGLPVLLHGQAPRYAARDHYVLDGTDPTRGYLRFTPAACAEAAALSGAELHSCIGIGALPDRYASSRVLWRCGLLAPPRLHYSFLAYFTL